jgi:hypothetical protein
MILCVHNRKFYISLTLLLLLTSNSNSQTYYKIPTDTNHYWRQFSACANGNSPTRYDYQIRYYKDTLINNQVYNKYARFGRGWGTACSSFIDNGFLRQDTINKLAFILDQNWMERPLYDFSKNVGGTILHYDKAINSIITATIAQIDTAYLFDGTKHKAFWTSTNNCFIEGVGSIFGGLYGDDQIFSDTVASSEQLICFGTIQPFFKVMEGITQTFYVCSFVSETVGVNQNGNSETLRIKIFPNPVGNKLHVEVDHSKAIESIFIIDALGNEFYKLFKPASTQEIDISDLPQGIYFLKLQSNSEQKTIKIIKE